MAWLAAVWTWMKGGFAFLGFAWAAIFPPHGDMDSAAGRMAADLPAFERVRDVLAAQPAIRWVAPSDHMDELFEPPNPDPVSDATRAGYRELAQFLASRQFRDIAPVRSGERLQSFRLVMVDEGYMGRQKLVEGVWLADGVPISQYAVNARCRAVAAPHWHVCQLN